MHAKSRVLVVVLLALVDRSPVDAAPGDPVGGEFQVNAYTTGYQGDPGVAANAAGGFVVVWGGDPGIRARRFDATGVPASDEFQVNTYTTGAGLPAVAGLLTGGFVVVWQSSVGGGSDTSGEAVEAQRFDAAGMPVDGEFQVNTYTTSHQDFPAVAATGDGGFVVVWTSDGSGGTDASDSSVQGQRFDAAGMPAGGEFQVNTHTTGRQLHVKVAPMGTGGFVVVWASDGSSGTDTSFTSVQGQRFDAAGAPIDDEFQVNTYTTSFQEVPAAAAEAGGGFVVLWSSTGSGGTDNSGTSIQGQRFDAAGVPLGSELQVNTYVAGGQENAAVASQPAGGFVVVWDSPGGGGTDTSDRAIQGRRFDADGAPLGGEFQVNTFATGRQAQPSVAPVDPGGFVVAWEGYGAADASFYGVQAQRFEGGIATTTTLGTTTTTTSTTSTTLPPGDSLEGRKLQLTSKPARPEKTKLVLLSTDASLTLGRGNQSADDPVLHGGALTIASAAGGFVGTHDLANAWKYVGKVGQGRGYRWKSRSAPIRSVLINKSGKLVITGRGAGLGIDLDVDPNPVRIRLTIGAHIYCLDFGGDDRRFRAGRVYRAKRAAAPAACP